MFVLPISHFMSLCVSLLPVINKFGNLILWTKDWPRWNNTNDRRLKASRMKLHCGLFLWACFAVQSDDIAWVIAADNGIGCLDEFREFISIPGHSLGRFTASDLIRAYDDEPSLTALMLRLWLPSQVLRNQTQAVNTYATAKRPCTVLWELALTFRRSLLLWRNRRPRISSSVRPQRYWRLLEELGCTQEIRQAYIFLLHVVVKLVNYCLVTSWEMNQTCTLSRWASNKHILYLDLFIYQTTLRSPSSLIYLGSIVPFETVPCTIIITAVPLVVESSTVRQKCVNDDVHWTPLTGLYDFVQQETCSHVQWVAVLQKWSYLFHTVLSQFMPNASLCLKSCTDRACCACEVFLWQNRRKRL